MTNPDCLQGNDFLNKFLQMYEQIREMGLSHKDTIKMLITQDFVRDFIDTPGWFVSAKKLPKGYKWIDMEESGAFCKIIGKIFDNPELLEVIE